MFLNKHEQAFGQHIPGHGGAGATILDTPRTTTPLKLLMSLYLDRLLHTFVSRSRRAQS